MTARYVILHHQVGGGEHWDLMLEHSDILLTWKFPRELEQAANFPVLAQRIQDHRKAYLDYEGPISGNRGSVTRVDRGTVTFIVFTESRIEIRLHGERLSGLFRLTPVGEDWFFELAGQT